MIHHTFAHQVTVTLSSPSPFVSPRGIFNTNQRFSPIISLSALSSLRGNKPTFSLNNLSLRVLIDELLKCYPSLFLTWPPKTPRPRVFAASAFELPSPQSARYTQERSESASDSTSLSFHISRLSRACASLPWLSSPYLFMQHGGGSHSQTQSRRPDHDATKRTPTDMTVKMTAGRLLLAMRLTRCRPQPGDWLQTLFPSRPSGL